MQEITIRRLKITCYLFSCFTNYDKAYSRVQGEENIDLHLEPHQAQVLIFLRGYGCRQFKLEDENISKNSLTKWINIHDNYLPGYSVNLHESHDEEIEKVEKFYDDLKELHASNKKTKKITFGPAGASKLLFAIRPNMFVPWDGPIIKNFKYKGTGKDYCKHLKYVKSRILDLKSECEAIGKTINDLPSLVGRESMPIPKLVDEYLWVNITKGCDPQELINIIKT